MAFLYYGGVITAKIFFRAFGRYEVKGRGNVPPRGPLIVVANHMSYDDPPVLVAAVPRHLHALAKQELFKNPIAAHFLNAWGVHPLDRDAKDMGALRWALRSLEEEKAVLLFPEGHRSRDARLHQAQTGAAYVAIKSQAPVLPVAIAGTERVQNFARIPFPFCRLRVWIGQPFTPPVLEGHVTRELLQSVADMMMQRIAALLPPEYRGYYATTAAPPAGTEPRRQPEKG